MPTRRFVQPTRALFPRPWPTVIVTFALTAAGVWWLFAPRGRATAALVGGLLAAALAAAVAVGPARQSWSAHVPVTEWAAFLVPTVIHGSLVVTGSYDESMTVPITLLIFPVFGWLPPLIRLVLRDRGDLRGRPRRVAKTLHGAFFVLFAIHSVLLLHTVLLAILAPASIAAAVLHILAADRYAQQLYVEPPRPVIRAD